MFPTIHKIQTVNSLQLVSLMSMDRKLSIKNETGKKTNEISIEYYIENGFSDSSKLANLNIFQIK